MTIGGITGAEKSSAIYIDAAPQGCSRTANILRQKLKAVPTRSCASVMASPLKALSVTLLLLAIALTHCHAYQGARGRHYPAGKHSTDHAIGRHYHHVALPKRHRPKFNPGPWTNAHATFYSGGSGTFGGACNYKDVVGEGYGMNTAALSSVMFNNGKTCGACYEIKCADDPQWCKPGQPSLFVTATDLCPPNPSLPSDNGGWCNPPREHFDIAQPVFAQVAEYKAGIIPVQYRRVPCKKQGGIRFTILGNPWFYQVIVWNVGGAGDVISVQVKGSQKLKWTQMERDWGSTWKTSATLMGESLTFRVRTSDKRYSTSWHITPENWQFGQTYEGKNFK